MSIRRTGLLVLVIVLLAPAAAFATGHNADLSGGGGGASGSKFWGFHEVIAKTCPQRKLAVLGDLSIYKGSENGIEQTLIGWMGGVRWTFALGPEKRDTNPRVTVSPHALVGAFHTNGAAGVFSFAAGGAVDFMLGNHASNEAGWGARFMTDYVVRHGDAHNLTRFSFDAVYQFGHKQ